MKPSPLKTTAILAAIVGVAVAGVLVMTILDSALIGVLLVALAVVTLLLVLGLPVSYGSQSGEGRATRAEEMEPGHDQDAP